MGLASSVAAEDSVGAVAGAGLGTGSAAAMGAASRPAGTGMSSGSGWVSGWLARKPSARAESPARSSMVTKVPPR